MQQHSVVVTGATGLLGTKVVQKLLASGDTVHAVVRRQPPPGHPVAKNNAGEVTLHTIDLAAGRLDWTWMETLQPAAAIHCAAMTNVDECERDPANAYAVNEQATRSLAEACARSGVHMLLVSTDYVFDGSDEHPGPYSEDDPARPINHYGRSKWLGERAVQDACEGRTGWSICRTAVVYGSTPWTRANFATWLLAKLRNRESTSIVYDQICSPTLADDLADMLIRLMRQRAGGVFHTAGSSIVNRYQIALALVNQFGLDSSLIRPVATGELRQAAPRPLKAGLRVDKITQQLGVAPLSLEAGLLRFMESGPN